MPTCSIRRCAIWHPASNNPHLKVLFTGGVLAETEGFEPSIHLSMYDDLANRCLQPLGHISANQKRSIPIEGHLTHCKNKASISVAGTHIGSTFPQFACYMGHPHIADQDMSGDKALKNDHTPRKGSRCWDNLLGITVCDVECGILRVVPRPGYTLRLHI